MSFALTEDQRMLRDSAHGFFDKQTSASRVRTLREGPDGLSFSREVYSEMAKLGFLGIPFDESHGGAGLGFAEVALVAEAMGRTLAAEPFLSSIAFAGQLIALAGTDEQKRQYLPGLIDGTTLLTVASHERGARHDVAATACKATATSDGFVLRGEKSLVLDGPTADALLVVARTAGEPGDLNGLSVFVVPCNAEGLTVSPQQWVDHRVAGLVTLKDVTVPRSALVGAVDLAIFPLVQATDRATVAQCAEMLGGMTAAFELTLDYLKERKQFGKRIGSFQALQHRAVDMFMAIELSRTTTMHAARLIDSEDMGVSQAVSIAKARCSDSYIHVTNEAVQMFAGIGMTDEHDIGFYMKRARVCAMTFGDAAFHRDRWGTLSGF